MGSDAKYACQHADSSLQVLTDDQQAEIRQGIMPADGTVAMCPKCLEIFNKKYKGDPIQWPD